MNQTLCIYDLVREDIITTTTTDYEHIGASIGETSSLIFITINVVVNFIDSIRAAIHPFKKNKKVRKVQNLYRIHFFKLVYPNNKDTNVKTYEYHRSLVIDSEEKEEFSSHKRSIILQKIINNVEIDGYFASQKQIALFMNNKIDMLIMTKKTYKKK